jgi:hypothetical protein
LLFELFSSPAGEVGDGFTEVTQSDDRILQRKTAFEAQKWSAVRAAEQSYDCGRALLLSGAASGSALHRPIHGSFGAAVDSCWCGFGISPKSSVVNHSSAVTRLFVADV